MVTRNGNNVKWDYKDTLTGARIKGSETFATPAEAIARENAINEILRGK